MDVAKLREALARVEAGIGAARVRSGRAERVTILAVTKGHPAPVVEAAWEAGLREVGENRVAELEAKRAEIRVPVKWHLVGHLQRNKVRRALGLFDLLHSLDTMRLAEVVSQEAERAGVEVPVLVQVNASGEETKGGFTVEAGVDSVGGVVGMAGLQVKGLMTMAPFTADEAVLRRTFARTRALYDECARAVPGFVAEHCSMGMSNDYEIAVEEGSTLVRLGTILFGERQG
ncbi:MAG: YggS family pyridoxal phosphate-dependent enzyme [Longimicrobiales bacterium]